MRLVRLLVAVIGVGVAPMLIAGCGSDSSEPGSHDRHDQHNSGNWQTPAAPGGGYWDEKGQPVNGGPVGADGSTNNAVTREYCAQNEDPACPAGSYVGPNAIPDPDGGPDYVPCEGTICTNPNHGAGDDPDSQNPPGCEGTICTNPNHGAGDDPDSQNPPGCEGTICTNPNHGAGDDPDSQNPPGN